MPAMQTSKLGEKGRQGDDGENGGFGEVVCWGSCLQGEQIFGPGNQNENVDWTSLFHWLGEPE